MMLVLAHPYELISSDLNSLLDEISDREHLKYFQLWIHLLRHTGKVHIVKKYFLERTLW